MKKSNCDTTWIEETGVPVFFILLFLYIIFFAGCAPVKTIITTTVTTTTPSIPTEKPEFIILNDDVLKKIGHPDSLFKTRLFLGGRIFGVRISPEKNTITVKDGIVFEENTNEHMEIISVNELTEILFLGYYKDEKLGTVLKIGVTPDASIENEKFVLFSQNKEGIFFIQTEDKYFCYEKEKYYLLNSPNAVLILFFKKEKIEKSDNLIILKGKKG